MLSSTDQFGSAGHGFRYVLSRQCSYEDEVSGLINVPAMRSARRVKCDLKISADVLMYFSTSHLTYAQSSLEILD